MDGYIRRRFIWLAPYTKALSGSQRGTLAPFWLPGSRISTIASHPSMEGQNLASHFDGKAAAVDFRVDPLNDDPLPGLIILQCSQCH